MKTYLEYNDIAWMEAAALIPRDRLLIRLLSRLGCRISEALAIKVDDIDFKQGTVTIIHLKRSIRISCPQCGIRLGNQHHFCPGCGIKVSQKIKKQQEKRRIRVLPVDQETMKMLENYIKTLCCNSRPYLFSLTRHRAWQIVGECARRAGLPPLVNPETGRVKGISPHRLRDAFSVNAMKVDDSGDGLRLLQEHLGHMSFNTTARYRKIAGEEHRHWYNRLWPRKP
jgi:integrase/recombinase XerD